MHHPLPLLESFQIRKQVAVTTHVELHSGFLGLLSPLLRRYEWALRTEDGGDCNTILETSEDGTKDHELTTSEISWQHGELLAHGSQLVAVQSTHTLKQLQGTFDRRGIRGRW